MTVNNDQAGTHPAGHSGSAVVIAFIAVVVLVGAYFALGMPGMNHGSGASMPGMKMEQPGSNAASLLAPAAFASAMAHQGAVLINVHVPYDGEIAGTDLFVPFDHIDPTLLPADHNTPLLIYCRTGHMSSTAASTLSGLGYTDVGELHGGMEAWRQAGREILHVPSHATTLEAGVASDRRQRTLPVVLVAG